MFKPFTYSPLKALAPADRRCSSKTAIICIALAATLASAFIALQGSISSPIYAVIYAFSHDDVYTPLAALGTRPSQDPAPTPPNPAQEPQVTLANGTLIGMHYEAEGQDVFWGVPYAQPPVGKLRFRMPQSLDEKWAQPRRAVEPAKVCWGWPVIYALGNAFQSEDCLYLNIFRPVMRSGSKLPVAVFFHGGAFETNSATTWKFGLKPTIRNSADSNMPIIVVSVNYRLAGWGLLASDELLASGDTNLALKDQRLALRWTQENIAAFGGDPDRVTIWGNSAGAASVGFHLLAYGGRDDGLFRGAIMQSGSPLPYAAMNGTRYHQTIYDNVVRHVGCHTGKGSLECLRGASVPEIIDAFNTLDLHGWFPFRDGDMIQEYPSLLLKEGKFLKVPILIGTNTDEGLDFAPFGVNTSEDFIDCVRAPTNMFPGASLDSTLAQKIAAVYPDDPCKGVAAASLGCTRLNGILGAQYRRCAQYRGDATMVANHRRTCEIWSENQLKVYSYRFNVLPGNVSFGVHGVKHTKEVEFAFNNEVGVLNYLQIPGQKPQQKADALTHRSNYLAISKEMNMAWISFIHSQDPNAFRQIDSNVSLQNNSLAPRWPVYSRSEPQNFVFDGDVANHVEDDTYRTEGIKVINDAVAEYQR